MNIVVLDGFTLNPGDLSWKGLEALGNCAVYDRTYPGDIVSRAGDAEIVLTNKTVLSRDVIGDLPKLRYIGVLATGYNVVDPAAAAERGIPVTNVPSYGSPAVAQAVFAHLLHLTNHVAEHAQSVRDGRWSASVDFCYWDYPLVELAGLTMGIVGYGRIGAAAADIASALGMRILAFDLRPPEAIPEGIRMTDLKTLLKESDVVSLHCPLTEENARMMDADTLSLMKPSAFLINTSRGGLIDESALADALNEGRIAGAGLDVLSSEPPEKDNPLLAAKNCAITPHIAWATRSARERLLEAVVGNVDAFLKGTPRNVVNGV